MSDDLKARLRAVGGVRHDGATRWYVNPDGPEAADRIDQLEAALRKYADEDYNGFNGSGAHARAALGEKKDER